MAKTEKGGQPCYWAGGDSKDTPKPDYLTAAYLTAGHRDQGIYAGAFVIGLDPVTGQPPQNPVLPMQAGAAAKLTL